jgi:hypothetical protein
VSQSYVGFYWPYYWREQSLQQQRDDLVRHPLRQYPRQSQ